MMIQPLPQSHYESARDGRTSTGDESPNEIFARALAQSIQAARSGDVAASLRGVPDGGTRAGLKRTESRADPRSEVAVARWRHDDRHDPTRPPVDRPERADHRRTDDRRTDEHRADEHRADDRGRDRTGRVDVTRPGESNSERPGAQEVNPTGDAADPDTPGSDNGKRVAFTDKAEGANRSGELDVLDPPPEAVLASLMGVDADSAAAFLDTLMAGLARSQGVDSAEELMAQLTALADQLGDGERGIGVDGADNGLVASVMDVAVEAGLVEPVAPDTDTDPAALLAALASAISGGGMSGGDSEDTADIEGTPTTVDGAEAGSGPAPADPEPVDGAAVTTTGPTGSAGSTHSGESPAVVGNGAGNPTSGGDDNAGVENPTSDGIDNDLAETATGDGAGLTAIDDSAGTTADDATTTTADGSADTAAGRVAPDPTMARSGDTSTGVAPTATPSGIGGPAGVHATGPTAAPSRAAAPTATTAQGLVELANNRLAEQLRPAFAAVRRGIDGLEELQLRLRNEGGAPIRVDISTVDNEVRVVLSGTNDDVMQRLGQERERLADELRRAGFTSTTIDVHSEGRDTDDRRSGTTGTPDLASGHTFDTNRPSDEEMAGVVSGTDRSVTTGLDLDL